VRCPFNNVDPTKQGMCAQSAADYDFTRPAPIIDVLLQPAAPLTHLGFIDLALIQP
jgi:hypothetical protein